MLWAEARGSPILGTCAYLYSMPALANVGDTIKVSLHFQSLGQAIGGFRQFWAFSGTRPAGPALSNFAGYVATHWQTLFAPLAPAAVNLVQVNTQDLTDQYGAVGSWAGAYAGTRAGTELPVSVAVLVNYGIAHHYRGGKPRNYMTLGVTSDVGGNGTTWTPAFVTAVQTAVGNWRSQLTQFAGGITVTNDVCVHYYKDSMPNSKGSIWDPANIPKPYPPGTNAPVDPIASATVSAAIGTQRRRLTPG